MIDRPNDTDAHEHLVNMDDYVPSWAKPSKLSRRQLSGDKRSFTWADAVTAIVVALCLFFAYIPWSKAQTMGVHLATAHFSNNHELNGVNPGVYYTGVNQVTIGTYYNSYKKETFYVARQFTTDNGLFSLAVGAGTGYSGRCPVCKALTPLVAPSFHYRIGDTSLRFVSPNLQGIHLTIERAIE